MKGQMHFLPNQAHSLQYIWNAGACSATSRIYVLGIHIKIGCLDVFELRQKHSKNFMLGGGGQDPPNVRTKKNTVTCHLYALVCDSETYTERQKKLVISSECHSLKSTNYNELYLDTE